MRNLDPTIVLWSIIGIYAVAMFIIVAVPLQGTHNYAKKTNQRLNYRHSLLDAKIKFARAMLDWFLWLPLLTKKEPGIRAYANVANRFVALGIALPLICLLLLFGHAGTDWAILAGLVEYLLVGLLARRVINQKRQYLSSLD